MMMMMMIMIIMAAKVSQEWQVTRAYLAPRVVLAGPQGIELLWLGSRTSTVAYHIVSYRIVLASHSQLVWIHVAVTVQGYRWSTRCGRQPRFHRNDRWPGLTGKTGSPWTSGSAGIHWWDGLHWHQGRSGSGRTAGRYRRYWIQWFVSRISLHFSICFIIRFSSSTEVMFLPVSA